MVQNIVIATTTTTAILDDESKPPTNDKSSTAAMTATTTWMGTNLPLLSLEQAVNGVDSTTTTTTPSTWTMGKWPDPILRRPAQPIPTKYYGTNLLQQAAIMLQQTANQEGAVGLAAQQCGIDARMVYLSLSSSSLSSSRRDKGTKNNNNHNNVQRKDHMILVNPHIIARSPEINMKIWNETCLVLPPSFHATVLRDDWIDVVYYTVNGKFMQQRFVNETSRCLQHELDHDRGILITDHLPLDELPTNMQPMETIGHTQRMELAYSRYLEDDY